MICHCARRDHSLLDPLDLELYPLAKVTSMPKAGGEQLSRLLRLPGAPSHRDNDRALSHSNGYGRREKKKG